ncbi:MAG: DinB family protein [Gordonia sp. (in: high G+C Gram-positive bacteria)]
MITRMVHDPRVHPPQSAAERASLTAFLDYHRATLAMKCEGVADDDLKRCAVAPSVLTLLGLIRHMAAVELSWFSVVLGGADAQPIWATNADDGFMVDASDVRETFVRWHDACSASRGILAQLPDLDYTVEFDGEPYSVRYVLLHMIEEYARHNGHADLLREAIDGQVGE